MEYKQYVKRFPVSRLPALNPRSEKVKPWLKKWRNWVFDAKDLVALNSDECAYIEQMFIDDDSSSVDLLINPSLQEFDFNLVDEDGVAFMNVKYRETALTDYVYCVRAKKNRGPIRSKPFIDAYITMCGENMKAKLVVALHDCKFYTPDSELETEGVVHQLLYSDKETAERCLNDEEYKGCLGLMINLAKNIYMSVQHVFITRPVSFIETTESHPMHWEHKKAAEPYRRVRYVRKITLNKSPYVTECNEHYKMQCPCWGVVGHWREYKSGKRIWIKPYKKGKQRNNPSAYSPKEYQI